jgi:hypothetical protein
VAASQGKPAWSDRFRQMRMSGRSFTLLDKDQAAGEDATRVANSWLLSNILSPIISRAIQVRGAGWRQPYAPREPRRSYDRPIIETQA